MGNFSPEQYSSTEFAVNMYAQYGEAYFTDLLDAVESAPLPHQAEGSTVDYAIVKSGQEDAPKVFFIPGYTENLVGKAPFVMEMAAEDFDVIFPHFTTDKVLKNEDGKRDATYTRALDLLAIIEHEDMQDTTMQVVAHSWGALVFTEMQAIAKERGWTCFDETDVVLAAPAGFKQHEKLTGFAKRFFPHLAGESKAIQTFPDYSKEMDKASKKNMFAAPIRSLLEVKDVLTKRVDLARMHKLGAATITVVGYAQDLLFPSSVLEEEVQKYVGDDATEDVPVSYITPISFDLRSNGDVMGVEGATHNDDSFTPKRVVRAIAQVLRKNRV